MSPATTHRPQHRLPSAAERLRLPIYQTGQQRMRERYGFDVNTPDALDRARALRAEHPLDAGPAVALAAALASRGDDAGAETEARAAVELDPQSGRAQTSLASLRMLRGDIAGALDHAQRAAALDPRDATVQYNLGLAAHASGDRSTAREAFRAADALLNGRDPAAPEARTRHWWQRG